MTTTTASTIAVDVHGGVPEPGVQRRVDPLGFGSAVAFVALVAVSYAVVPAAPTVAAAADTVSSYYTDHAFGVRLFALVQSAAAVAFLVHACWLASQARASRHGSLLHDVVLGAGLVITALSLLSAATIASLAFGISASADVAVVHGLHQLADLMLDIGDLMITVLIGSVTFAAASDRRSPRWLTALGALVAVAWVLGSSAVVATDGAFAGATGPYGTAIVALLVLWMLANSTRRPGAQVEIASITTAT